MQQRGGEPGVCANLDHDVVAGLGDGVLPRGEGAVGPVGGEGGGLVGVPGFDPPGRILSGDEGFPVGLPAELPGDGMPCDRAAVGGLGGSEPSLSLLGVGLDHRQAGVSGFGDQLPAAPGQRPADQARHPPAAIPPRQLDKLVPVRVDVHADREQPFPRDAGVPGPVVLHEVNAIGRDDVRLGDDVALGERAVVEPGHQVQAAAVGDLADATGGEDLVRRFVGGRRVRVGLVGELAQVVDHGVQVRVRRRVLPGFFSRHSARRSARRFRRSGPSNLYCRSPRIRYGHLVAFLGRIGLVRKREQAFALGRFRCGLLRPRCGRLGLAGAPPPLLSHAAPPPAAGTRTPRCGVPPLRAVRYALRRR